MQSLPARQLAGGRSRLGDARSCTDPDLFSIAERRESESEGLSSEASTSPREEQRAFSPACG